MAESIAAGATPQQLAAALQLEDTTWITRFRRLLRLSPRVQHLVNWGTSQSTISLTIGTEISRLPSKSDQEELAQAALEDRLTSAEVRQIVQIVLRGGQSAKEAIASVTAQRPQIVKRHVLIGAILDHTLQSTLRGMRQDDRDVLLREAMSRYAPSLPQWEGRLGPKSFTLSGGEDFDRAMQSHEGGFEVAVNNFLESAVLNR